MGNETSLQQNTNLKVWWTEWNTSSGSEIKPRTGHCATAPLNGGGVYIFGGIIDAPQGKETNSLLKFCPSTRTWVELSTTGDIPSSRVDSVMSSVDDKLYLFGGYHEGEGWLNDLHTYNTETLHWMLINTKSPELTPSPRSKPSSAVIGDNIYYFGGCGPVQTGSCNNSGELASVPENRPLNDKEDLFYYNDIFTLNTDDMSWLRYNPPVDEQPLPRSGHAMCAINGQLMMFGGQTSNKQFNDLHMFDPDMGRWFRIPTSGSVPIGRSLHSLTAVGDKIIVIGGETNSHNILNDIYILDTESREWIEPAVVGTVLPPCSQHTCFIVGENLLLYGGFRNQNNDDQSYNSIFSCYIDELITQDESTHSQATPDSGPITFTAHTTNSTHGSPAHCSPSIHSPLKSSGGSRKSPYSISHSPRRSQKSPKLIARIIRANGTCTKTVNGFILEESLSEQVKQLNLKDKTANYT